MQFDDNTGATSTCPTMADQEIGTGVEEREPLQWPSITARRCKLNTKAAKEKSPAAEMRRGSAHRTRPYILKSTSAEYDLKPCTYTCSVCARP